MAIIKVITPSVTDANITTVKVTDNAITLAKMASGTDGNIISYDASGNPVAVATGNDGQVLTSTGAGSPPVFENASGTTINNNANNRVITGSGTANTLEGEANLIFNGSTLAIGSGTATNNAGTPNLAITAEGCMVFLRRANNNGHLMNFANTSGGVTGRIDNDASNTTYATSSDYRLKENIDYNFDATTRLKQLKPARFNFIIDETNTLQDGFIAHEVSDVVPKAVLGTKDATETYTDDNGNEQTRPTYQSIDHSMLVPLLVKTIQELEARITELENA